MAATKIREVKTKSNYEQFAGMDAHQRLAADPVVWGHVLLQDVVVGVHNMNLGTAPSAGPAFSGAPSMAFYWRSPLRTASMACARS